MKRSKKKQVRRAAAISPSGATAPGKVVSAHQYITIGRYHRNLANAEVYVIDLFRSSHSGISLNDARSSTLRSGNDKEKFEVNFNAAVKDARERGTAEVLRSFLNGRDPYYTFEMSMSADGEGTSIELGFAGQKLSLPTPMRQGSIEDELTEDVLRHRQLACEGARANHDGFRSTGMHFRGYLLASCALVEAFLNRCVLIDVFERRTSPELDELQRPCNVERRFELWLKYFAGEPLSSINRGAEWDHYSELRRLRNSLMHSEHSILGIALKDAARQLNLVRRGVGGLVNALRALQQLPPIPFAERLETAPECAFQTRVTRRPPRSNGAPV